MQQLRTLRSNGVSIYSSRSARPSLLTGQKIPARLDTPRPRSLAGIFSPWSRSGAAP
jgi:hypothetical protein